MLCLINISNEYADELFKNTPKKGDPLYNTNKKRALHRTMKKNRTGTHTNIQHSGEKKDFSISISTYWSKYWLEVFHL